MEAVFSLVIEGLNESQLSDPLIGAVMLYFRKYLKFPEQAVLDFTDDDCRDVANPATKMAILRAIWILFIRSPYINPGTCEAQLLLVTRGHCTLVEALSLARLNEEIYEGDDIGSQFLAESAKLTYKIKDLTLEELNEMVTHTMVSVRFSKFYRKAFTEFNERRFQNAFEIFKRGKEMVDFFPKIIESLYENWPNFLLARGVCYCIQGLKMEAIENFEFVKQLNSMPIYVKFVASLLNAITMLLCRQEEKFNSEIDKTKIYLKEKSMFKDSATQHFTLGVMVGEFMTGEPTIIDYILLHALEIFPSNVTLIMLRAGSLKFNGKMEKSLECLNTLFKLLPNSGLPYILRASVLKDRSAAFEECTKAIEIAIANGGSELAAAYLLRGSMLWDSAHEREGIEDLNKVEQLTPDDYDLYYNRGVRHMNLGLINEADADFEKAIKIFPRDFQAYLNSGIIKLRIGDTSGGLKLFSRAIEINPRYANCWLKRGNLYYVMRNFKDALYDLEQAMKVASNGWVHYRDCADLIADCKNEIERERIEIEE